MSVTPVKTAVNSALPSHDTPAMTKHMSSLNRYREVLQQLQGTWDNLSLLSQLSGTGTDMSETRHAFGQVTTDVLDSLAAETLNKTVTAISAKAQVAVDIVVRNLFERTADIGFLATDNKLSDFLDKHLAGLADDEDCLLLQQRFAEYVKKYSVYFNVILLDSNGHVLVQLDDHNPVQASADPLIKEALHSNAPYIEVFRHSDLVPDAASSLIYASKVHHDDAETALGVLCLCFRFENEMQGIFEHLIRKEDWCVGLLLDSDKRVIASSDHYQIPLGVQLETAQMQTATADSGMQDQDWIITRFAGRLYLAVTRATKGYQGYMGPGWCGHVMVPLDHAFDDNVASIIAGIDVKLLGKVMRSPLLFSPTLLGIPRQAATIQSKLNQSVWNGNIWQKRDSSHNPQQNSFSKMLLWEISNTGFKTQNVIEKTVADLYQTVVSVMLENSRFFASLAVDIMDRNLYERANDCRWWALTATFQQLLAKPVLTSQDQAAITKVLSYINRAYTVYDNLVVFDRNGSIVATSNPAYHGLIGETIAADWARAALNLRDTQEYVVSAFEPSPLYRNKSTYIYAAAIRNDEQTVGGIGIVFDSTPQFSAMLADALPRNADSTAVAGSFTLYVDDKLRVISSTSSEFSIGSEFTLQPELCQLAKGGAAFDIVLYNGNYYAVGARASSGYREYKDAQDSYQNHVTALIFIPLGKAAEINAMMETERQLQHNQFKPATAQAQAQNPDAEEYATFYIGQHWLGLPAAQIIEAIQVNDIKSLPDTSSVLEGMLKHQDNVVPVLNLAKLTGVEIQIPERDKQVIIVQAGPKLPKFGLLVSALGEIPAIAPDAIESLSSLFATVNIPAEGIAKVMTERGENLLILLSANNLITRISEAAQQLNAQPGNTAVKTSAAYPGSEMLEQAA